MKIKKTLASILLASTMMLSACPLTAMAEATDDQSLQNFLKTTDNIQASYAYPSMKLSANSTGKSTLVAHTPIVIRSVETISTKDIVNGSIVNFEVVSDVRDNSGNILIKSGTPVTAQITFSKPKGRIGKSGKVTVEDFHTTATDGTYIPLSGSISAKPDDKMVLSIVLSAVICPLFLLMKGNEAQVPAGTTKTVYTVSDVYIKPINS